MYKENENMKEDWRTKEGSTVVGSGVAAALFRRYLSGAVRVLDLGSGNGRFIEGIADSGSSIVAADTEDFLSDAARQCAERFISIDINEHLPFPDQSFDAVAAWNVIEHAENPYRAAREVARVLRPGGIFLLSVPNIWNLRNRLYFLRTGDMYRYRGRGSHRAILTKMLFEKAFLSRFELVSRGFIIFEPPCFPRFLSFLRVLVPPTELFGKTAYFILRRR